jgi:iron(III) transport system permease protein
MSIASVSRNARLEARPRPLAGRAASLFAIAFFLAPLAALFAIAVSGGITTVPGWSNLSTTLRDTGLLLLGVGLLAMIFALPLAWVVSRYDFPLRRAIEIVSVLPLALPTYLSAYAYVSLSDHFGPLQTVLRAATGLERLPWFPDLRSMGGACFVMAAALFPYVYVPARWSFERQSARQIEAARNLGASSRALFFKIAMPLAWPAIVAGLTLALLETLNDIGATQYLGVQSLTVATFTTWTVRDNLPGAAQMALMLLLIVAMLIHAERWSRQTRHYADPSRHMAVSDRRKLHGLRAWLLTLIAAVPSMIGFFAPASVLAVAAWRDLSRNGLRPDVADALFSTIILALLATAVIVLIGFGLALAHRLRSGKIEALSLRFSAIGYAIPGLILVIGLMPLIGAIDQALHAIGLIGTAVVSGSYAILIIAYALRFTSISSGQAEAALQRLSRNVDHAAVTLGGSRGRLIRDILAPQILTATGAATILILVDCVKELPATLVLRPLNVETLSTLVYGAASRGSFEDGATAALLIVLIGLVPLTLLFRMTARET